MADERRLAGQVAVVTGASRGLGRVIARALAAAGARVVMAARTHDALEAAAAEIRREGGEALPVVADVTQERDAAALIHQAEAAYGGVDLLVNNVGHMLRRPLVETTPEEWDEMMRTKLRAAYLCSRAALPGMQRRKSGLIVNVASGGAFNGAANHVAFCASEFAVRGFTNALAEEVREQGVRVTVLCPMGTIETEKTRGRPGVPSTWLDPEDLARAVIFLATQSPRSLTTELVIRPPAPVYG